MPKKQSTVLIQCNRRGSVSAGPASCEKEGQTPLTFKPGINELDEADQKRFEKFKKTKLGAALVKDKTLTFAAEDIEPKPEIEIKESDAGDEAASDTSDTPEDSSDAPRAPTLDLPAKEAVDFLKTVTDEDVLRECYEQDSRPTVKAACEARAEELDDTSKGEDPEGEDPEGEG